MKRILKSFQGSGKAFAFFKAMDKLYQVILEIPITICKEIQKIITKMDFGYQTGMNKNAKEVGLV